MKRRVLPILAVMMATLAAVPGAARADDPPSKPKAEASTADLESLLEEKVVSTASKSAETSESAPATSTLITAEELRRYGIRSLDEALNFLSMGVVVEDQIKDKELGARGVHFVADYGNHVLLLVNGHTMNEQMGGTVYFDRGTGIPFELIDHIEVILGPGSVLYGSNAMFAVINIVTKRAKDWEGVHAVVESELPISIRTAAGVGHEFKLFGTPSEVTLELEYYAQNGPAFKFGPQTYLVDGKPTGHWGGVANKDNYGQLPTGYLRFFSGNLEVNVRGEYWKRGDPTVNIDTFDDPGSYEVDRWLTGDARYRMVLSPTVDLTSRLYGDTYDYRQYYPIQPSADDCQAGMPHGCLYRLIAVSRWVGLEEQLNLDWLKNGTITTLVGVDARVRNIGGKTDYIEFVTHRTDGSYSQFDLTEKALGAYAQQVLRPWKQAEANGGIRLDVDDHFGAHASPRVALAAHPWEDGTFKAIYSEAFRAPSGYERYYADPGSQISAPDLKPETVQSFEATFDQRGRSQHVLFGVFLTKYDDLVAEHKLTDAELKAAVADGALETGTTSAGQYRNFARVDAWGFNTVYEGALLGARLRYGASLTSAIAHSYASERAPAAILPVAPQVSGNARVSYDFGDPWPTLGLATHFIGSRAATGAFTGYFSPDPYGPVFVETRATLSGKIPGVQGLSYRATLNYVSTGSLPYTVGPSGFPTPNSTGPGQHPFVGELNPVDRLRTGIGLSYDRGL